MRKLLDRPGRRAALFARDERGGMTVETVIVILPLAMVFLSMFVWWEAFRAEATTVKATYTVADMISRENEPINNAYITGMHRVYRYMVATPEATWMRVTSVRYTAANDRYTVLWSRTTHTARAPALTNTTLAAMTHRLPRLSDADTLIMVETWRSYRPAFNVGIKSGAFYEMSVTRPRFLSPLPIS